MVKTPFPTHSHLYPLLALVAFVLAAFGCSDDSPSGPPPNVFPGEPTVITEGPATLSLPAGDHLVLDGQGASPFRVDVEIGRNDAEVPIDEGESLVSEIITIRHDQAGPLPIASDDDSDPFARLTLAFDPTLLPEDETPDDLNTVVVARYPTESEGTGGPEHTEMATARAVGDIDAEAGTIEIAISLLPQRMDLAVVYAPDLVSLAETVDPIDPVWVTPNPPFPCCAVYVVYPEAPADRDCTLPEYDNNSGCRFRRLAEQMEGSGDAAAIDRVVRQRVMNPTFKAMRTYRNLGLRQPKLEFRPVAGQEASQMVLYAGYGGSRYIYSGPFPQLNIEMRVIESDSNPLVGTVQGHIFHEMMHSIVEGYDIATVHIGNVRSLRGFNEALAMVYEHTFETEETVAQVRSGKDYAVYPLDMPLGSYENPYANDDFLAYLFRRYLNNDFTFPAGDQGLLELMATYSRQDDLPTGESLRQAYLFGLHDAIGAATSGAATLGDAFDSFVRNRFYEHDEASRLRSDDTHPPNTALTERFSSSNNLGIVTITDGTAVTIPSAQAPVWALDGDLSPMSAALIVFTAGFTTGGARYEGELQLDFQPDLVPIEADGLRITLYRDGSDSSPGVPLAGSQYVDPNFGTGHQNLYVLIVNTSIEVAAGLTIQATPEGVAPTTGSVAVTVQRADNGSPVNDATVEARDSTDAVAASSTTDSNGYTLLLNLPAGRYTVRANASGFQPGSQTVDVVAGERSNLTISLDAEDTDGFNARLFGNIAVHERWSTTSLSPSGVTVTAFDESWSQVAQTTLDESGEYDLQFPCSLDLAHPRGPDPNNVHGFNAYFIIRAERADLATWSALLPVVVPPSNLTTGEPCGNGTTSSMMPVNPDCTSDDNLFMLTNYGEAEFYDDYTDVGEEAFTHPDAASYCISGSASAPTFRWETARVNPALLPDTWFEVRELSESGSLVARLYTVIGHPNEQPITYGEAGEGVTTDLPAPPLRADGTRYEVRFSAMPSGQSFWLR